MFMPMAFMSGATGEIYRQFSHHADLPPCCFQYLWQ
ncbi:hypothetical protein ACNKHV_22405 [Shigella flexneri]